MKILELETGDIVAKFLFIKANRQKGTGKTGNPYDFANITVSVGIESFDIACFPPLATSIKEGLIDLRKKDSFQALISLEQTHRGLEWVIQEVVKVEKKELVKN